MKVFSLWRCNYIFPAMYFWRQSRWVCDKSKGYELTHDYFMALEFINFWCSTAPRGAAAAAKHTHVSYTRGINLYHLLRRARSTLIRAPSSAICGPSALCDMIRTWWAYQNYLDHPLKYRGRGFDDTLFVKRLRVLRYSTFYTDVSVAHLYMRYCQRHKSLKETAHFSLLRFITPN